MFSFQKTIPCDLDYEKLEEIRMNTGFKQNEIIAYRKRFLSYITSPIVDYHANRTMKKSNSSKLLDMLPDGGDSPKKGKKKELEKEKEKEKEKDDNEDEVKSTSDEQSHSSTLSEELLETDKAQARPATPTTTPAEEPVDLNTITRTQFLNIQLIAMNPLRDRLALLFDLNSADSFLTFEEYMDKVCQFNCIGNREAKVSGWGGGVRQRHAARQAERAQRNLHNPSNFHTSKISKLTNPTQLKLAFKIQDFDGDEKLDRHDLSKYYGLIARLGSVETKVAKDDRRQIVQYILSEASSDPRQKYLSFEDFQRVVAPTDFDSMLRLKL